MGITLWMSGIKELEMDQPHANGDYSGDYSMTYDKAFEKSMSAPHSWGFFMLEKAFIPYFPYFIYQNF